MFELSLALLDYLFPPPPPPEKKETRVFSHIRRAERIIDFRPNALKRIYHKEWFLQFFTPFDEFHLNCDICMEKISIDRGGGMKGVQYSSLSRHIYAKHFPLYYDILKKNNILEEAAESGVVLF
jgi:hypothetical protein